MSNKVEPIEVHLPVFGREMAGLYWSGEGVPIVCLHGWLDNANSFLPLMEYAREKDTTHLGKRPVLALDFTGHGRSDHAPDFELLHLVDHVQDVMEAIRQMEWKRVSLIGHSLGGIVASMFAPAFCLETKDLVMIDGLGARTTPKGELASNLRKAIEGREHRETKAPAVYADFNTAVESRMKGTFPVSQKAAALLCMRGLQFGPQGWTWTADPRLRAASALRLTEEEVREFLESIQCPTLFVGAKQGIAGMGWLDERLECLQHAEIKTLEGGHHLHMETPDIVVEEIEAFYRGTSKG